MPIRHVLGPRPPLKIKTKDVPLVGFKRKLEREFSGEQRDLKAQSSNNVEAKEESSKLEQTTTTNRFEDLPGTGRETPNQGNGSASWRSGRRDNIISQKSEAETKTFETANSRPNIDLYGYSDNSQVQAGKGGHFLTTRGLPIRRTYAGLNEYVKSGSKASGAGTLHPADHSNLSHGPQQYGHQNGQPIVPSTPNDLFREPKIMNSRSTPIRPNSRMGQVARLRAEQQVKQRGAGIRQPAHVMFVDKASGKAQSYFDGYHLVEGAAATMTLPARSGMNTANQNPIITTKLRIRKGLTSARSPTAQRARRTLEKAKRLDDARKRSSLDEMSGTDQVKGQYPSEDKSTNTVMRLPEPNRPGSDHPIQVASSAKRRDASPLGTNSASIGESALSMPETPLIRTHHSQPKGVVAKILQQKIKEKMQAKARLEAADIQYRFTRESVTGKNKGPIKGIKLLRTFPSSPSLRHVTQRDSIQTGLAALAARQLAKEEGKFDRAHARARINDKNMTDETHRQQLTKEMSIGSALESHHADSFDLQLQDLTTRSSEPRREASSGRAFRSVSPKSARAPRSSIFTKRSAASPRRNTLSAPTRRMKRKLEYLSRIRSSGKEIILKTGLPNVSEAYNNGVPDSIPTSNLLMTKKPLGSPTPLDDLSARERSAATLVDHDAPAPTSPERGLPSSNEPRPTPPDDLIMKYGFRDDFNHVNREEIPFEDSWFDDIRQEQPPEVSQQNPVTSQHKLSNDRNEEKVVPFRAARPAANRVTSSLDSPSENQVSPDASVSSQSVPSTTASPINEKTDSLPSPEQIIHNTLTASPAISETPTEAVLKAVQRLSLREELFPEESRSAKAESTPIMKKKGTTTSELPQMPFAVDSLKQVDELSARKGSVAYKELSPPDKVAVLLLETASTALSDDDFQRLTVKGKHIEEWRSAGGSVKVIPARDLDTLINRGFYFLIFPNKHLATTYLDQARSLHKIAQTYTPTSIDSPMAPPPGMVINGQNIHRLMQDFTLCPPGQELQIKLLPRPHAMKVRRLIDDDGYRNIDVPRRPRRSGRSVVFWLKWYPPTTTAVIEFLTQDGRIRGLPWGPIDGRGAVEKLADEKAPDARDSWMPDEQDEPREDESKQDGADGMEDGFDQGSPSVSGEAASYPRWIISFEDENEARRFVRTWHQQPWPGRIATDDISYGYGDSSPLIQAEFLW